MTYTSIDWNAVWKDLSEKNIECRGSGGCAAIWESKEKARTYLERSQEEPEQTRCTIDGLPVKIESTVLDIGAGPGVLAVPLARRVARVTAVEPAAGMAEVMTEYARGEGVSNLSIVRKRWEDGDPAADLDGPYDIVIASYSLGMPDIRAAIEKMCEASSRWVYLFWFAGTTSWEQGMLDLWPRLHGKEYRRGHPLQRPLFDGDLPERRDVVDGVHPPVPGPRCRHERVPGAVPGNVPGAGGGSP